MTEYNGLTNEQEKMWAYLKCDPQVLVHQWAEEMLSVKKSKIKLNKLAEEYLSYMIEHFSIQDTARVIKTWLTTYKLPLEPDRITSFDAFHDYCGSYIHNYCDKLTAFER